MKRTSGSITSRPPKPRLRALFVALLTLLLTGCSTSTPSLFPPEPLVTQRPAPTPIPDGELSLSYVYNAQTAAQGMHPLTTRSRDLLNLYSLIYEGLYQLDANMVPQPALGSAVPSASGLLWTVTLRKDVVFHDGKPLTTADVAATIDAMLASATPGIWNIAPVIDSYTITDDRVMTIRAKKSSYDMLYALCFPIFPKSGITRAAPPGTGPYRVVSFTLRQKIVLERNPDWWKRAPYVSDITFTAYPSHDAELSAYERGDIDLVGTQTLNAARYRETGDTNTVDYLTQDYEFLAPNFGSALMQDLNIRRAIYCAIDRKAILQGVYLNHGIATDGPIPPDSWLYDARIAIHDYDPDEARSILDAAGWTAGPTGARGRYAAGGETQLLSVTLLTNEDVNNPERRSAALLIQEQLQAVGFTVELVCEPMEQLQKRIEARGFDLLLTGMYMDRIPQLGPLLSTNGSGNIMKYSNRQLDFQLDASSTSFHDADYRLAINTVQRTIAEDLPVISLYFRTGTMISRKRIEGIESVRELQLYRGLERWIVRPETTP